MVDLIVLLVLLLVTYGTGRWFEQRHFESIRQREAQLLPLLTSTLSTIPSSAPVERSEMVCGSVVVSLDYFKRFIAGLRGIIGGRIKPYEPLLDRARREAMLRMRERARAEGFDMVVNVRLETSRLASAAADGKRTAGVEILAFGTAVKLAAAG
ncbi:MAG: YbjQ family protein [Myxococcales bacterium]|nr:YbjQ family protein [Myxococcales bacterium]